MKAVDKFKFIFSPLARAFVTACTILLLLVCLLIGRLFYAPINLDVSRESVLNRAGGLLPGWNIAYTSAELGWNWRSVRPWLSLNEITLVDRRDRLVATIPEAQLGVSFVGMFHSAGISHIGLEKARIHISDLAGFSDTTDNSLLADMFAFEGFPKPIILKPVTEAFNRFATRLLARAPQLETIVLRESYISVARGDGLPDLNLSIPIMRLERNGEEFQVTSQIDAYLASQPVRIRASGVADPLAGDLSINLSFTDIDLSLIAAEAPLPEFFSYMNFPIGGDLGLDLTNSVGLRSASFQLDIGEGYLRDPIAFPKSALIRYGTITGALDLAEDIVAIDSISLATAERTVTGEGLIFWNEVDSGAGVRVDLQTAEATIPEVLNYWPAKVYPDGSPRGARAWVEHNMGKGTAKNAAFSIRLSPDGSGPFRDGSPFRLTFDLLDVDTRYLGDMPPVEHIMGRATLTRTAFSFEIDEGYIAGLPIAGSAGDIVGIHTPGETSGTFDILMQGPLPQIMAVIDSPPVSITDRTGITLDRLDGLADVTARISLPFVKKPEDIAVTYSVQARVTDGVVRDILGGEGLSGSNVSLSLDNDNLTAEGRGLLNGVPMDFYWRENFAAGRLNPLEDTSFLVMSGWVDETKLQSLGVEVPDYLHGTALADISFLGRNLKFRLGYFTADVTDAEIMVPQLGWKKPAAVPASLTGTLYLDEANIRLAPLTLTGESIDATATVEFGPKDSGVFSIKAAIEQMGHNRLTAEVSANGAEPTRAVITADTFDLAPLIKAKEQPEDTTVTALETAGEKAGTPFYLTFSAKELLLLNGEKLTNADINLRMVDNQPKEMSFTAHDKAGMTRVLIESTGGQNQKMSAESQDAGAILRGLGLFPHVQNGGLTLTAETRGWAERLYLKGTLKVQDSFLVSSETLGKQVTEGIIKGFDSYVGKDRLDMAVITFPFTLDKGLLDITGMKANGSSLGMTMEGEIQTTEGKINVNGVVVPAYGINSILGKIPLLGGLFSGGDGKGLFGITYRVKGMTREPKVTVNPLSGLAPGFLRLLFEGGKGSVDTVDTPQTPEASKAPQQPDQEELAPVAMPPQQVEEDPAPLP